MSTLDVDHRLILREHLIDHPESRLEDTARIISQVKHKTFHTPLLQLSKCLHKVIVRAEREAVQADHSKRVAHHILGADLARRYGTTLYLDRAQVISGGVTEGKGHHALIGTLEQAHDGVGRDLTLDRSSVDAHDAITGSDTDQVGGSIGDCPDHDGCVLEGIENYTYAVEIALQLLSLLLPLFCRQVA